MQLADIDWSPISADFSVSNIYKSLFGPIDPAIIQTATTTKPLLGKSGILSSGAMQNTSDFMAMNFTLDPSATATHLPGVFTFSSPAIPDFLKAATSLNTTTNKPSAGAIALANQLNMPWYKNKTTLMVVGGVAAIAAALFVFTGNAPKRAKRR